MKLFALVLTAASVFASAQMAAAGTACSCYELNRRVQGLQYAQQYGGARVQREIQDGRATLNQSRSMNQAQQESVCSASNQRINYAWVQWQPWVSQSGADIGNPCER